MPRKTDERKINFELDPDMDINQCIEVRLEDKGVVIEVEQIGGFCEEDGLSDCECDACLDKFRTYRKSYAEMGIEVKDV